MEAIRKKSVETICMRPLSSLAENPRNARKHSKAQIKQIAELIRTIGFWNPIVLDENGMVLAGHGRLAAAKLLKMESVPTVTMAGLTDTEKRVLALADNKVAQNAGWDREMLALELGDLAELLPALNWDLSITGFPSVEIDCLMEDHGAAKPGSEDKIPALQQIAVTQPGDLWRLGKHHLLCGDARSSDDRFEAGKVYLPTRAPWLADLEAELFSFPGSRYDDQIDSISQAINHPSTIASWLRFGAAMDE